MAKTELYIVRSVNKNGTWRAVKEDVGEITGKENWLEILNEGDMLVVKLKQPRHISDIARVMFREEAQKYMGGKLC